MSKENTDVWDSDFKKLMLAIAKTINDHYGVNNISRDVIENERELSREVERQREERRILNQNTQDENEANFDSLDELIPKQSDNPVQDRANEIFETMTSPQMQERYEKLGGEDKLSGPKADKAKQLAEYEAIINRTGKEEDTLDLLSMSDSELIRLDIVTLRGYLKDLDISFDKTLDKEGLIKLIHQDNLNTSEEESDEEVLTWNDITKMSNKELMSLCDEYNISYSEGDSSQVLLQKLDLEL